VGAVSAASAGGASTDDDDMITMSQCFGFNCLLCDSLCC